ncbi:hypothetical protein MRB53_039964 [Persea americana]|nr:hypothetical protein MRB53_039964 [Persea americana]
MQALYADWETAVQQRGLEVDAVGVAGAGVEEAREFFENRLLAGQRCDGLDPRERLAQVCRGAVGEGGVLRLGGPDQADAVVSPADDQGTTEMHTSASFQPSARATSAPDRSVETQIKMVPRAVPMRLAISLVESARNAERAGAECAFSSKKATSILRYCSRAQLRSRFDRACELKAKATP